MGFTSAGEPVCDTCNKVFGGSTATALVLGWGIWAGTDHSGAFHEHVICRECRKEEKKRQVRPVQAFEDEPLF